MALKPRHKRRILWSLISLIGALVLAVILVPPMITLNKFKPMVEKSIYDQTNVPAKLNGDIHFSLIGGATIVAHDVVVPTAKIGSVMFSIPFRALFDIQNAKLNDAVVIYDADISVDKLSPAKFNHDIEIYNSQIDFMGRKFNIIRADFTDGAFHGTIRSDEHKYDVEFIGSQIHIKNRNNDLDIIGQMYSDDSIRGQMSLNTNNVNAWFGFSEPKLDQNITMTTDFEWDGGTGYKFTNIVGDNFSGNIEFLPNGDRTIQLVSDDTTFDFSFLFTPDRIRHTTKYNLDLYGHLTLGKRVFNHLKINAISTQDKIQITNLIADDIVITGGTVTSDGAHDIMIMMPINGVNTMCIFSGTPTNWGCSKFTYGNISGSISVSDNKYNVIAQSNEPLPNLDEMKKLLSRLGTHGTVRFKFADVGGTYTITDKSVTATYDFAKNQNLQWAKIDLPFLPKYMLTDTGDFTWNNNMLTFTPHNKQWQLSTYDNYFYLSGTSFKSWIPNLDIPFINDGPYTISGFYNNTSISNLTINIAGHEFSGNASGDTITLHTDTLSVDDFTNPEFIQHFAEQEFLTNEPVLTLFDLPIKLSVSANQIVFDGITYNNFVYALKPDSQTFSISDSARGNLLVTIERNGINYDIFIQLNKFVIRGLLLSDKMPLNIRDTVITADIALNTYGQIAHDIRYNMSGALDMSFDDFYASAENITHLNAEYALANALGGGETKIKHMHIIGTYDQGNFITTAPIELSMRHTDAIGGLAITNGMMTAEFDLTLRGTAPTPVTIQLSILPDGGRSYSLSDIMQNLDIGFMRAFIRTRDKF